MGMALASFAIALTVPSPSQRAETKLRDLRIEVDDPGANLTEGSVLEVMYGFYARALSFRDSRSPRQQVY